jgi:energy-coupling factor transporter ATP-binding protein EcfA2
MKLHRLWVKDYKNLRECEIDFSQSKLLTAIIGINGSGKSNLIEAILHILIGVYFKKKPEFDFSFEFETQQRQIKIESKNRRYSIHVDGRLVPLKHFAERLRNGSAQVYYPELTFVYYSGECQRVRRLISRYQKHLYHLTRKENIDGHRPLFVESANQQAKNILLALFTHGHAEFVQRLGLSSMVEVSITLRSPAGFDPKENEPKLWGTEGAVREIVAAIDDTGESKESRRPEYGIADESGTQIEGIVGHIDHTEIRTYRFSDGERKGKTIYDLARRLGENDNLYLALEHLKARGILVGVNYRLKGGAGTDAFEFDHLSEGEKQLIAVVGAIWLTNRPDNLVLLDEPDTHLNPHWSWDYTEMLTESFKDEQKLRSTVLMATHDPVMISGLMKEQVLLAKAPADKIPTFVHPLRNPRGQGVANLLCSNEFFGLPSSLDKQTQILLVERLKLSVKPRLDETDKARLKKLNSDLEIIMPGVSERDPEYVAFLRQKYESKRA